LPRRPGFAQKKEFTYIGSAGEKAAPDLGFVEVADGAARAEIKEVEIMGVIPAEMKKMAADVSDKTGVSPSFDDLSDAGLAAALANTDVVIHCTPVGMHSKEGQSVVPAELWRPELDVMDIVYNPAETRLIMDARAAGCRVVYGREMLLNQGALQFETWTGQKAPVEVMRKALEAGLGR
jgi:shikimate dehydrogenase